MADPETITLLGTTLHWRSCTLGEHLYADDAWTLHLYRAGDRWQAHVVADGYWTQRWGSLEAVESELTKWRPLKRQAWWRRVWRWYFGG